MVAKEQRFTKQRIMFPQIFETLGVVHFKQRALDNSTFIIKNENGVALDYILGDEPLPTIRRRTLLHNSYRAS